MKKNILALCVTIAFAPLSHAQTGNVGFGTSTPMTKLDVNGAITNREVLVSVAANAATIPANWSQARLTGSATASISITAPVAPNAGQRLIIYNNTTGGFAAMLNGYGVSAGQAVEFTYSNAQWVATSNGLSAGNFWGLTGNTGTDPLVNFLGTGDLQPLRSKVNNVHSGYIGLTTFAAGGSQDLNTAFGYGAGGDVMARMQASNNFRKNTAIGYMAMGTGSGASTTENTAVGYAAGGSLGATSTRNTFVGGVAGNSMTEGSRNTAVGQGAMFLSTGGDQNVAMGWSAGASSGTGSYNTYLGTLSGSNGTGSGNILLGYSAGTNHTGSNRLMIDNSGTNTPIIDGDLAARLLTINNNLKVAALAGTGDRSVVADASGTLKIGSGAVFQSIRKTVNTTESIMSDDYTLISKAGSASTLSLPDPATCKGRLLIIVNHSAADITFDRPITKDETDTPGSAVAHGTVLTLSAVENFINTVSAGNKMTIQSSGDEWILVGI